MNSLIHLNELTEQDTLARQPDNIDINLKNHQLTILHKARQLETSVLSNQINESIETSFIKTRIGILCDQVGAGKSYVILSLILDDTPVRNDPVINSYNNGLICVSSVEHRQNINTNLLVIPHNLCNQWIDYVQRFKKDIPFILISKKNHFTKLTETGILGYKLIIVTCTMYNKLAIYIDSNNYSLKRIIYDEVDTLNIPARSIELKSSFYWYVTASYGNLIWPRGHKIYDYQNRRYVTYANGLVSSSFLRNTFFEIISRLSEHIYSKLFLKNKDEYVQSSMNLPEIELHKIECKCKTILNILSGIVDNQIMNYLNANDVQGAINLICPGHKQSEESIIGILIDKFNRHLNNFEVRLNYTNLMTFDNQNDKEQEITRINDKITELKQKIQAIQERVQGNNTCPICYDECDNKTILSCCSNSFCFKCINTWFINQKVCPLCKHLVNRNEEMYVVNNNDTNMDIDMIEYPIVNDPSVIGSHNDKMQNLENIIKNCSVNSKFLIFSSYDHPLHEIGNILNKNNKKFAYLKGNNYVIKNIVDNYRSGDIDVLLINTTYYGSGLNLENTTDIIMFHKFDNEIEKQVIGRAQRYGREESLRVWYLLHSNEMSS